MGPSYERGETPFQMVIVSGRWAPRVPRGSDPRRLVQTTAVDPDRFAQDLFRPLPRRYDLLEELLSFGQNWRWRREMVAHVEGNDPKAILDVATGTAGVALSLARHTRAQITGVDITEAMLRRGHERVARAEAADRGRLPLRPRAP